MRKCCYSCSICHHCGVLTTAASVNFSVYSLGSYFSRLLLPPSLHLRDREVDLPNFLEATVNLCWCLCSLEVMEGMCLYLCILLPNCSFRDCGHWNTAHWQFQNLDSYCCWNFMWSKLSPGCHFHNLFSSQCCGLACNFEFFFSLDVFWVCWLSPSHLFYT